MSAVTAPGGAGVEAGASTAAAANIVLGLGLGNSCRPACKEAVMAPAQLERTGLNIFTGI